MWAAGSRFVAQLYSLMSLSQRISCVCSLSDQKWLTVSISRGGCRDRRLAAFTTLSDLRSLTSVLSPPSHVTNEVL
jgi:hypothetical protein